MGDVCPVGTKNAHFVYVPFELCTRIPIENGTS